MASTSYVPWTAICFAGAALVFVMGVIMMQMDVMAFLVTVPIPYIFGSIIALNMFQNSLAARLSQPAKGVANAVLVIIIGTALAQLYRRLLPVVTGALAFGPPPALRWRDLAGLSATCRHVSIPDFLRRVFKSWPLAKSK